MNKKIHRDHQSTSKTFNSRSLEVDYPTLIPLLKKGLRILDVGCGTGAISSGIARYIEPGGYVIGIDNSEKFILSGKEAYHDTANLTLVHSDLFDFHNDEKFDLIISARTLQWLSNPKDALLKMKSLIKPNGQVSILDYNHEALEWHPKPPESMLVFYSAFLKWRADAGMDNRISEHLVDYFKEAGFYKVEAFDSNEVYKREDSNFIERVSIWSKVAGLKQIVQEGYITEELQLKAIEEYNDWIISNGQKMEMKLKEVRGTFNEAYTL